MDVDLNTLLKTLIHEMAAITVNEATQRDLALAISRHGPFKAYLLYTPDKLREIVEREAKADPKTAIPDAIEWYTNEWIVGSITTQRSRNVHNGAQVRTSVAQHGYGPMLYDIAMYDNGGLTCDPLDISDDTRRIWKHYFYHRTNVGRRFIAHCNNDRNDPLNYVYFTSMHQGTETLERNHRDMLSFLKQHGIGDSELKKCGAIFFDTFDDPDPLGTRTPNEADK